MITACLSPTTISVPILDQLIFHYLDLAMKRNESDIYEAVARMLHRLSRLRNADDVVARYVARSRPMPDIIRLLTMINSGRPIPRQIAALSTGQIALTGCDIPMSSVVGALLRQLDDAAKVSRSIQRGTRMLTSAGRR